LLFTCAASPRTLSLAASLGLPRQRQAGRLELSHAVTSRLATTTPPREKDVSLRLLQPTSFTSTLRTVRFLVAHRAARRLATPRGPSAPTHPGSTVGSLPPSCPRAAAELGARRAACRMNPPGEASLDGEPPASVFATTITRHAAARGMRPCASGVERGPGGAPIDGSSALHLPVAVFSTARRARDVASDALCRAPRRIRHRCRIPIASGRRTRLCRRLVKDDHVCRLRTPSIAECSLPRARLTLARLRVGSRGARHRIRCSRARGFRHREPASSAISPTERARVSVRARGLDPRPCGLDQALLVDFCNHNNPRARPLDRLSPVSRRTDRAPCSRRGQRRLGVR